MDIERISLSGCQLLLRLSTNSSNCWE